jgi:type I restriction enzyme R subunit
MNLENFVVRPKRLFVEKYSQPTAWNNLSEQQFDELAREVAGLPSELVDDDEDAKRFDLLILGLQLAVLNAEPGFERLRGQVRKIVEALEDQSSIPAIRDQMVLIEAVAGEEWWKDVTVPMLEVARRHLRPLVNLIEKGKKKIVYTDFEDELGAETEVTLPEVGNGLDFDRYKAKVKQFLTEHLDHIALQKVRRNIALTKSDLDDLEALLKKSGVGSQENLEQAKTKSQALGLFIRSLVGLDREAATHALGAFVSGSALTPSQTEFVKMIIDHLTLHGVIEPSALYESPFVDISPRGPEDVFPDAKITQLISVLEEIKQRAAA